MATYTEALRVATELLKAYSGHAWLQRVYVDWRREKTPDPYNDHIVNVLILADSSQTIAPVINGVEVVVEYTRTTI